jgi:predicted amidohydrolase YtcJ
MVRNGYGEEQKLSLDEGVALYTSNAAYLSFDEDRLGRIETGSAADLTILDSDIDEMHPAMIRRVRIATTIANGNLVYSYEGMS